MGIFHLLGNLAQYKWTAVLKLTDSSQSTVPSYLYTKYELFSLHHWIWSAFTALKVLMKHSQTPDFWKLRSCYVSLLTSHKCCTCYQPLSNSKASLQLRHQQIYVVLPAGHRDQNLAHYQTGCTTLMEFWWKPSRNHHGWFGLWADSVLSNCPLGSYVSVQVPAKLLYCLIASWSIINEVPLARYCTLPCLCCKNGETKQNEIDEANLKLMVCFLRGEWFF